MAYPVTVDALHTVFSPYGFVQKIAIFEKGGQHQVRPSSASMHDRQYAASHPCLVVSSWDWLSRTSVYQSQSMPCGRGRS